MGGDKFRCFLLAAAVACAAPIAAESASAVSLAEPLDGHQQRVGTRAEFAWIQGTYEFEPRLEIGMSQELATDVAKEIHRPYINTFTTVFTSPGVRFWRVCASYLGSAEIEDRCSSTRSLIILPLAMCDNGLDDDDDGQVDEEDWACTQDWLDSETLIVTPQLTMRRSRKLGQSAIARKFRDFRSAYAPTTRCGRASRTRSVCRISWCTGDLCSSGRVALSLTRRGEEVYWSYRATVNQLNEYCAVLGKGKCAKTFRWRQRPRWLPK